MCVSNMILFKICSTQRVRLHQTLARTLTMTVLAWEPGEKRRRKSQTVMALSASMCLSYPFTGMTGSLMMRRCFVAYFRDMALCYLFMWVLVLYIGDLVKCFYTQIWVRKTRALYITVCVFMFLSASCLWATWNEVGHCHHGWFYGSPSSQALCPRRCLRFRDDGATKYRVACNPDTPTAVVYVFTCFGLACSVLSVTWC